MTRLAQLSSRDFVRLVGRWFTDLTVPAAAATGVAVGAAVFTFDWIVTRSLDAIREGPSWVGVVAPALAVSLAALIIRTASGPAGRRDRATADEYLRNFHEPGRSLTFRSFAVRLSAATATLALGAPLGLEGPSLLIGAGTARGLFGRMKPRWARRIDAEAMLVAGAAAAVAAIFKAPAAGAVFALEVPFRRDLARHQLMPALTGAAFGYLAFVFGDGTAPLFPVAGSPPFDLRDLFGAVVLGVVCGGLARLIALSLRSAKRMAATTSLRTTAFAAIGLAAAAGATFWIAGEPIGLGPGYQLMAWAKRPDVATATVAALLGIRFLAVLLATAGGGVGGLFIPLVVIGDLTGHVVGGIVGGPAQTLFPVLGIAAVLGAGYQVPLAAVMFVAETSGRSGFVVPALLAAVAADLIVGSESVTDYQRDRAM